MFQDRNIVRLKDNVEPAEYRGLIGIIEGESRAGDYKVTFYRGGFFQHLFREDQLEPAGLAYGPTTNDGKYLSETGQYYYVSPVGYGNSPVGILKNLRQITVGSIRPSFRRGGELVFTITYGLPGVRGMFTADAKDLYLSASAVVEELVRRQRSLIEEATDRLAKLHSDLETIKL